MIGELAVLGIAVNGLGLPDWAWARSVFRGEVEGAPPGAEPAPATRMNSRDRRRASDTVRLAVELGFAAAESAGLAPGDLPAVFASCHGEGAATHKLLKALAEPKPFISPTLFHNSVHNTPAGYWSITAGTRAPTTSICAGAVTFAAALVKAGMIVKLHETPALVVAYDAPFPDPLGRQCPFPGPLGVAMVLAPGKTPKAVSRLSFSLEQACSIPPTRVSTTASLGLLSDLNPIGQSIPLLEAIARESGRIVMDFGSGAGLIIVVQRGGSHTD